MTLSLVSYLSTSWAPCVRRRASEHTAQHLHTVAVGSSVRTQSETCRVSYFTVRRVLRSYAVISHQSGRDFGRCSESKLKGHCDRAPRIEDDRPT